MHVIRAFFRKLSRLKYEFRCLLFPFNVVKIRSLPRTWCDRDYLMFHAMFQILVDFVELEHPFTSARCSKRFTDGTAMREWIEKHYNSDEARDGWYCDGMFSSRDESDKNLAEHYAKHVEILFLYEWYKDKKYDFDQAAVRELAGKKLTNRELYEMEQKHDLLCDDMLHRIIGIKNYLWT